MEFERPLHTYEIRERDTSREIPSRLQSMDEPPFLAKIQSRKKIMDNFLEDTIDPMVKGAIYRKTLVMKSRNLPIARGLLKAKSNLETYQTKLSRLEKDLENHPRVVNLKATIDMMDDYTKRTSVLENNVDSKYGKLQSNFEENEKAKTMKIQYLKEINHNTITLGAMVRFLRGELAKKKGSPGVKYHHRLNSQNLMSVPEESSDNNPEPRHGRSTSQEIRTQDALTASQTVKLHKRVASVVFNGRRGSQEIETPECDNIAIRLKKPPLVEERYMDESASLHKRDSSRTLNKSDTRNRIPPLHLKKIRMFPSIGGTLGSCDLSSQSRAWSKKSSIDQSNSSIFQQHALKDHIKIPYRYNNFNSFLRDSSSVVHFNDHNEISPERMERSQMISTLYKLWRACSELRKIIFEKTESFIDLNNLWKVAFNEYNKRFQRKQRVTTNGLDGLRGSLLFDFVAQDKARQSIQSFPSFDPSKVGDAHLQILFKTFKDMETGLKHTETRKNLKFTVPWEDFITLNSLQILALIVFADGGIETLSKPWNDKANNVLMLQNEAQTLGKQLNYYQHWIPNANSTMNSTLHFSGSVSSILHGGHNRNSLILQTGGGLK